MSTNKNKPQINLIKLSDDECSKLLDSVSSKLNIQKPQFFYPIYNKLINGEESSSEDLKGLIFDSKFKCKEVLAKIIDNDEEYEDCSDSVSQNSHESSDNKSTIEPNIREIKDIEDLNDEDVNINDILNNSDHIDLPTDNVIDDNESDMPDDEIDEAINNTFVITGIVEKINKSTGEKQLTEEKIFVKKSPLLEPLKVMQDIYVIPEKITNKHLTDGTILNTNSKLNSYNNSSHVEALFLYLANKLVEVGKCPSFPFYYGCINGNDPNYHHNITDEYDSISRTKWFRDRIKNDFDLLIIEDNEEFEEEMMEELRKQNEFNGFGSMDESSSNSDSDSNTDTDTDTNTNTNTDSNEDGEDNIIENADDINLVDTVGSSVTSDPGTTGEPFTNITSGDHSTNTILTTSSNVANLQDGGDLATETLTNDTLNEILTNAEPVNLDFIKSLDDEDLNLDEDIITIPLTNTTANTSIDTPTDTTTDTTIENTITPGTDDDFIESLSDFDKENVDLSDFEDDNKFKLYYLKCEQMPVNLCLMEHMDATLDGILDDGYNMSETEWFSVFFQIAYGLAVAQKYFSFVHNDLHSSNIMFKNTQMKNMYFEVNGVYYKIPLFGKITKIIDFARGTFKFGDRWVFSDQFKDDGEACGQYDYPTDGSLKNCEFKPNPSFDLVRLGTTVIERVDGEQKVMDFVERITIDDNGNSVCYNEDTFQLYIDIARTCHNAIPIEVITQSKEFSRFKIAQEKIPKGQYIFHY